MLRYVGCIGTGKRIPEKNATRNDKYVWSRMKCVLSCMIIFFDEKLLCGFFFYDRTDRPTSKHDQNKYEKKRQKLTYTRLNIMAWT